MNIPVDLADVLTWPQAIVAVVIVVAVLIVPQVIQLVQNAGLKRQTAAVSHQVTNNGGSSMKDAVDRIERTLTEHVETSAQRAVEMDARLSELEKQPT